MKVGKTLLEHQVDGVVKMSDVLTKRFFLYASSIEKFPPAPDRGEHKMDSDYLTNLSKSIGYLTLVSAGVQKSFKQEKRLKVIEDKLERMPINMQMFEEPHLEKWK